MKDINCTSYFASPVYTYIDKSWIKDLNKISDEYLKNSYGKTKKQIDERNKIVGNVKDHGFSYHSDQLIGDKRIKNFENLLLDMSWNLLNSQGYLTNYGCKNLQRVEEVIMTLTYMVITIYQVFIF